MTTTFLVPKKDPAKKAWRVFHALPTRRSWSPGTNGYAATDLSFAPETGKTYYEKDEDSYQVEWEVREAPQDKRLSFVSHFKVESVRRHFDSSTCHVQWSDYHSKREEINPKLMKVAERVRKQHPPAEAVLEFCRWIDSNLTYDASVDYGDDDVKSIMKHRKGHCGHYQTIFRALCAGAGIPMRGVSGLNLYSPDGRTDGLQDVRPDFTNIHVWAEVEFPGIGWVEVEPAGGDDAYEIPARYIQNNKWFQNYEVYFEEGGEWKEPDWNLVQGRWVSPFQLEHIVTYRAKTLAANKRRVP